MLLTTSYGTPVSDNQNSLRLGPRRASFIEDFVLQEKLSHLTGSAFLFDHLDPTMLNPEELVPVTFIVHMKLGRNPDKFFEEAAIAAVSPKHIVPGLDFCNEPLPQGRLFSHLDI